MTPPLQMGWANSDGTATVYLTTDPGLNEISLTFSNQLTTVVTLAPGTPAPWGSLPPAQSAIYLFPEGLLPNPAVQFIRVTPRSGIQWAVASYVDPKTGFAYLVLAPAAAVAMAPGQELGFLLTNLVPASGRSGPVYAFFPNLTGAPDAQGPAEVSVSVGEPPPGDG